jgi:hypothetical protein
MKVYGGGWGMGKKGDSITSRKNNLMDSYLVIVRWLLVLSPSSLFILRLSSIMLFKKSSMASSQSSKSKLEKWGQRYK